MFSNGTSVWLYGGGVSLVPNLQPPFPPNNVWRYDFPNGQWSQALVGGDPVQRLMYGVTTPSGNSKAFHLGGVKSPDSDAVFDAVPDRKNYMVEGLLEFDEDKQTFRNISTTGMNRMGTVCKGFLSSIDAVGSQGILVAFGGYTFAAGKAFDELPVSLEGQTMQNITTYDIGNDRWYHQQATGDIPSDRYDGCSTVVSAVDQTSYSIYVFGGTGMTSDPNDDDGAIYVLSVPSFTWIRVTNDSDQRFRHTCHLMGRNHMVVVGGHKPSRNALNYHYDISTCDGNPNFSQGLGIFSLNDHDWRTDYDPAIGSTPYMIHSSISKIIGGNATGGATKREPVQGFSSDELRKLLHVDKLASNTSTNSSSTPTNPTAGLETVPDSQSPSILGTGAIAGIAVGILRRVYISTATPPMPPSAPIGDLYLERRYRASSPYALCSYRSRCRPRITGGPRRKSGGRIGEDVPESRDVELYREI
ncbi:MAG: hypothetical protein Q9216_003996 [Gyalolechia sp. 2 TL-2023]